MPFNATDVIRRIEVDAAKRLLRDALTLQAEHKKRLSVANPRPHNNPSLPGQYPKARTFNLRDSVAIEPMSLAMIIRTGRVRVGVLLGAKYGEYLSAGVRPYRGKKPREGSPNAPWLIAPRKGILDTHRDLKAAGRYVSGPASG